MRSTVDVEVFHYRGGETWSAQEFLRLIAEAVASISDDGAIIPAVARPSGVGPKNKGGVE